MEKQKLSLFSALETVLDMADETQSHDIEKNHAAKIRGFCDQVNVKAQAEAIKRVSELYKLLKSEQKGGELT